MGNAQGCCSADGGAHPSRSLYDVEQESPFRDSTLFTRGRDGDSYSERSSQAHAPAEATPPPCDGTLSVTVVSCADLGSTKRGAKPPESFVQLHLGGANHGLPQRTDDAERSFAPTFDQTFEFRLAAGASHAACTLTAAVWSKSKLPGGNSLLGEAQVSVREAFSGRWAERIGGEWDLADDFARSGAVAAVQQRGQSATGRKLGVLELQLRFRPDVPDLGMGLTLLPRSKRPSQILRAGAGRAVQQQRAPMLTPPPSDGWLRVHIRRCAGLLPTGGGTTDSLVSLAVGGGEAKRTDAHIQTLDPRFDESFEFFLDCGAPPGSCTLLLQVVSPKGEPLGELELQPCAEFALGNWKKRVKKEWALTDRLNRVPAREKKKRSGQPNPCGTVALTLEFEPVDLSEPVEELWDGFTPTAWRTGAARPNREERVRQEVARAERLPPTHLH